MLRTVLLSILLLTAVASRSQGQKELPTSSFRTDSTVMIGEVVITARQPDVLLRGDTTVINAQNFKTPPGSYLETLMSRIPGLIYDRQKKTLVYHGKNIEGVCVNGQTFFNNDIEIALKNLSVDLISKIKIYDKRDERERITRVRSGGKHYVLDIQTKNEFDGMLFSSAKVGWGSVNKQQQALTSNYFRQNGDNISLYAQRSNAEQTVRYKGNIATFAAFNFNKNISQKLSVNGSINYNASRNGRLSSSYNEQYLTTGNRYLSQTGEHFSTLRMFSGNGGMRWNISEKSLLGLQFSLSRTVSHNHSTNARATFDARPMLDARHPFTESKSYAPESIINEVHGSSKGDDKSNDYNITANFTQRLNESGTSLSLKGEYSQATARSNHFDRSTTTYHRLHSALGGDSLYLLDRYSQSPTTRKQTYGELSFSQPIGANVSVQLAYKFSASRESTHHNTYDLSPFDNRHSPIGTLPPLYRQGFVDSLSNHSRSTTTTNELRCTFNYNCEPFEIEADLVLSPQHRSISQNEGAVKIDTTLRMTIFSPSFNISWQREQVTLAASYSGSTSLPPLRSLLTLTDDRDPLYKTQGNPNLRSTYSQNIRFNADLTRLGLSASAEWQNELNSVTEDIVYNAQTGSRTTRPVNINGNWSADGEVYYRQSFGAFNINTNIRGDYSQNVALMNAERSYTRSNSMQCGLQANYAPKWGRIALQTLWNIHRSTYTQNHSHDLLRHYSTSLDAYATMFDCLTLNTTVTYSLRSGTNVQRKDRSQIVWNTSAEWRFLHKKQLTLGLSWNDILSQRRSYQRDADLTGLNETYTPQIGSYALVTLRYDFNLILNK